MKLQTITIRTCLPSDDEAVGALLLAAFEAAYQLKRPEFKMSEERRIELRDVAKKRSDGVVLVAIRNDEIVGSVTAYLPLSPACGAWINDYAEIRYLSLKPELHGSGLGRQLMSEAFNRCRHNKSQGACIRVRRGLDQLAAYYVKMGFKRDRTGDQERSDDVYLDGYSLRLDLSTCKPR